MKRRKKMKIMSKTILGAVLLTIFITITGASAQTKQPKFLLINSVKEDVNYVFQSDDPADILSGKVISFRFETVEEDKKRAESALQKVKQLIDDGMPESESIDLASGKTTIGELSEKLLSRHRDMSKVLLAKEFFQAGTGTKAFVDDIASGKLTDSTAYGDPLAAAKIHSERLLKAVTEAQKLGF